MKLKLVDLNCLCCRAPIDASNATDGFVVCACCDTKFEVERQAPRAVPSPPPPSQTTRTVAEQSPTLRVNQAFFSLCTSNKLAEAQTMYSQESGIDVAFTALGDNTALCLAAHKGHIEVVKWLIEIGSPLEAKNSEGKTALIRAVFVGHIEIAKTLIEAGADVNAMDKDSRTALIHAAMNKVPELVQMLVENSAKCGITDKTGKTALEYAAMYKKHLRAEQVVAILLENNQN